MSQGKLASCSLNTPLCHRKQWGALTFSGDGVTDGGPTCQSTGWLYPSHWRGLTFLFCSLAQTKAAIFRSAQAINLS